MQADEIVADKGFDGAPQRDACHARGLFANLPSKSNRIDPDLFLLDGYRERNRVERLFAKAKQYRRFATRYEKRKSMYLGIVHLVFTFLRLRRFANASIA